MSLIQIETVFNIDLEFEVAPFHKRLLAYLIDYALLIAYIFSMKYLLYNGLGISLQENMGLDILLISLPMLLYSLLTELWMNGQTIGKKLMAIRVISLDGGEPTMGQYLLRWITKFFEWPFLFGYVFFSAESLIVYTMMTGMLGLGVIIIIAVSRKSQRLGDIAAGTVLVNAKTDLSVNDTVFMEVTNQNYVVSFPEVMRLTDNDINTIKTVLTQANKRNNYDIAVRVEYKIKDVLQIRTNMGGVDFLTKLLEDYNYLATKE
ncbi:MAG: domain containing protein [Ferruginibacter sp.]|nr:domain containing protein [Ferruginibacter sp.]